MNDDVERELEQFKLIVEDVERRLSDQGRDYPGSAIPVDRDVGDDEPSSSVPASPKPTRPSRNSGAVALPEPEENTFSDPQPMSGVPKPPGQNSTASL
jgi:hypothetical protein